MPSKIRPDVHIPDHEVLRKVGGGSYGEVWLARGVTGAWRAVKIVWREDFEDERGFEREFEGILKYEPVSRDHPSLVNILHVGRSKKADDPFYYYVMELGDDILTGNEINPVEYEARTLRSDLLQADGNPIDIDFCLEVGLKLSEGLEHLHERGLAHRDVKPANIIFVGGKAKLADIGLVAPRGQRTFVGTEGFVPPEGPGSAQADVYSLGKVLYEMMSGKDRLQFPELPDELPGGEKRKLWLAMNQVICDICEPKVSKRTIVNAAQLADAVRRLQLGKRVRKKRNATLVKVILITLLIIGGVVGVNSYRESQQMNSANVVEVATASVNNGEAKDAAAVAQEPEHEFCAIKLNTTPPYATVYENGILLEQVTPTDFRDFKPGDIVTYRLELDGFKTVEKEYKVPDQAIWLIDEAFDTYRPPVVDQMWNGPFGASYLPQGIEHVSGFIRRSHFERFLKANERVNEHTFLPFSENGEQIQVALMGQKDAEQFAKWIEQRAKKQGLLEDDQMITFKQDRDVVISGFGDTHRAAGKLPTRCVVKRIPYSNLVITSEPAGARVYVDGEWLGVTPIDVEKLRPGAVNIELRLDGFKKYQELLNLADNEARPLMVKLKQNNGVVFSSKWTNSLSMPMVPVGSTLMAAIWETRVRDYKAFTTATGHREPRPAGYRQTPDHPVVGVSRADAEAFCAWLTQKERKEERISEYHRYKLPSDLEWSSLSELIEDENLSPSERDHKAQKDPFLSGEFIWEGEFPPTSAVANLADISAARALGVAKKNTISEYDDGFEKTSPVGNYPPSELGLHDLAGNVYEWVESSYNEGSKLGVVRGGSWAAFKANHLKVWSRFPISKTFRGNQFGFRVVLVDEIEEPEELNDLEE